MSINYKYDYENLREYITVSVQYSMRHILFLIFYICLFLSFGSFQYERGVYNGTEIEFERMKAYQDSDHKWLSEKEHKLNEKENEYLDIIENQRNKYKELEKKFNDKLRATTEE